MIQTDTDISFPLLLNLKMTNVKPIWVSSLFCSHILFSKRISFHPQGELWAAACVCASNIVCRSTWWGSGEWRVKSSPSSARQALGPASLGPWHTEFSPTSLLPWPCFFFFEYCHLFVMPFERNLHLSAVGVQRVSLFGAHKGTVKAGSQPWTWSHSRKGHLSTALNLQIRKVHQSWRPSSPTRFCYWSSSMGCKKISEISILARSSSWSHYRPQEK